MANWRLDLDARARLPAVGAEGPDLEVAIAGPLSEARVALNLERLARAMARRVRASR